MKRRRGPRGFTLIEILIALGLSTVGLLGMLALQTVAIRGNASSRNFTEAVGIAQAQLEAAQLVPYANLSSLAGTATNVGPTTAALYTPTAKATTEDLYTRTIAVAPGVEPNTQIVTVTVSWTGGDHRAHQVVLATKRSM